MSHKAVAWAIEQKVPSLQKLVLIMLSERHNRDTGRCDPSIARLAEDCGMSKDATRAALQNLQDRGLVEVQKRSDGSRQISNFYRLAFDGPLPGGSGSDRLPPLAVNDGGSGPKRSGVVAQTDRGVVAQTDTNQGSLLNLGNRTGEENQHQLSFAPPVGLKDMAPDSTRESPQDCAKAMLEGLPIPASESTHRMASEAIRKHAREASCSVYDAALMIERQASDAIARGERVNRFWFEDSEWTPSGRPTPNAGVGIYRGDVPAMPPSRELESTTTQVETGLVFDHVEAETAAVIWKAAQQKLQSDVNPKSYQTWLAPLTPFGFRSGKLYLHPPNEHFAHVGKRFAGELQKVLPDGVSICLYGRVPLKAAS